MTRLPYRDHTFVRFLSTRTGEMLFEIKMLDRATIERLHVSVATPAICA